MGHSQIHRHISVIPVACPSSTHSIPKVTPPLCTQTQIGVRLWLADVVEGCVLECALLRCHAVLAVLSVPIKLPLLALIPYCPLCSSLPSRLAPAHVRSPGLLICWQPPARRSRPVRGGLYWLIIILNYLCELRSLGSCHTISSAFVHHTPS